MAFFGTKKKTEEKKTAEPVAKTPVVVADLRAVLKRPRLTEKAANLTVQNVYTFDVMRGATKLDVVRAVKALYKVTPTKVNVVNQRGKRVTLRTRRGLGSRVASRKVYVYLKAGDKIDFAA